MSGIPTQAVLDIVREVLDLNEASPATAVDPADDLYDLGFDSLLIIQVAARVRERLGVDPPLAAYFEAGTVAELAQAVAAAGLSSLEPTP